MKRSSRNSVCSALTDDFSVSYVPSGSVLALLARKHRPLDGSSLLAVGDPIFDRPPPSDPPSHGVLIRSEEMPTTERPRSWAAGWSDEPLDMPLQPHPATALVRRDETLLCSSVLPWRGARPRSPDEGADTAGITAATLARLRPALMAHDGTVIWEATGTMPCRAASTRAAPLAERRSSSSSPRGA